MSKHAFIGFILTVGLGSYAWAGPRSDGGAKGVLCTTPSQSTLESLDIYEAKNIYQFGEAPRQSSLLSEFAFGLERLNRTWAEPGENGPHRPSDREAQEVMEKEFLKSVRKIPQGSRLPVTNDATIPVLPPNCRQVQIAIFNSLGIQLDMAYWGMLDARNQAAILFHEALYQYRKKYGAIDSDETRRFVGQLFSAKPPTPRFQGASEIGYVDCTARGNNSPEYHFAVYPTVEGGQKVTVFSFRQLQNATVLGRTTVTMNGWNHYEAVANASEMGMSYEIRSESRDETRSFNFHKKSDQSGRITITVSTRDEYTGEVSQTSTGSCALK